MRLYCRLLFIVMLVGWVSLTCTRNRTKDLPQKKAKSTLFSKLSPDKTGITFSNTITDSFEFNLLQYPFMYNGGGVAVGDINNDGLADIFLTGNQVSSRLYLNKGEMQFEDITESAGVMTDRWITGASMVDIDNNGYLDIYLSVVSPEDAPAQERANLLFINKGDQTFTEAAGEYGIADTSFTTHAAFLDYNRDGLPDLFLLNHSPGSFSRDMAGSEQMPGKRALSTSYDHLYQNTGDPPAGGQVPTFTNVSKQAGLLEKTGYGLGVAVADINRDGWPDIYISNDIAPNDVLYINNRDGTFSDRSGDYLKHTSFAGMGVDIADFNNDGWPDIMQADMMPPDYQDRKLMSYGVSYERFINRIKQGYHYAYTKNTLQMSNGMDDAGNMVFSEVGRMAGVAYTDWSWAVLFGDYDNSGHKDIMITNGYPKAVNDFDYLIEMAQADPSGTGDSNLKYRYQLLQDLSDINIPNYLFRNDGGIIFSDVSEEWGFVDPVYSYGAAHADLNNDGSLDIVINNINAPASVYQNNSGELSGNHYLMVELKGSEQNRQGIGAKVILTAGGKQQYVYQNPYRGYQSSVDPTLHFGLGKRSQVDSLEVFWPDGRYQLITELESDRQVTVSYANSVEIPDKSNPPVAENRVFTEVTDEVGLLYKHKENGFNDYQVQPLLHRQLSKMGPKIATGDVTGNGLDDVFIGGAAGYAGTLYLQHDDGRFEEFNRNQPWLESQSREDMGALFFDANGDGLMDLYVASGGYEFSPVEDAMLDRLYINSGNGRFYKDESALPRMYTSSSVVVPGDFNGDGEEDLFVGGRLIPLKYPRPARSYILQNNGGTFRDVTNEVAPELVEPGLITDAAWLDFDGDGQLDLITTGIWLPVQFYKNEGGKLSEVTDTMVEEPQRGWWYSLQKGDFDNNGSTDIVAGNLGLNHTFTTSDEKKFGVFASDFNKDMTVDIIYTVEEDGTQYPFFGRARLGRSLDFINEKYKTFTSFSGVPLDDILNSDDLDASLHHQVDTFASTFFQNEGNGTFAVQELPEAAQISPVNGIISHDVDRDGNLDLLLAGNIFAVHPDISRADAGNGLWMKGNGEGGFEPVSPFESGFLAPGDVKDLKLITTPSGKAVLVANNSGFLQVFSIE